MTSCLGTLQMLSTKKIKKSLILPGGHTPVGGENLNTVI